MKIIITGGHHTSALPVIDELRARGDIQIFWVGHKYPPLEHREVTELGIPFYELKAGKVYRNLGGLVRLPIGFIQAFVLLMKLKPNVILSFGGYLAAPVVFAGWVLGIPSITHEQTVTVGYANKFISIFAKKVLVSWEQSAGHFPKNKVVLSGLPLRRSILEVKSNSFEVNESLPTIYVTAGKTGSRLVNRTIYGSLDELLTFANVIHQTGEHSEDIVEAAGRAGRYIPRRYIARDEIGEVFHKANLVIGRAGAHTCAEIMALKKPALLIPISWVSHNEQYKNAEVVREFGLAEILEEKDLNVQNLVARVKSMIANLSKYKIQEGAMPKGFVPGNAAKIIVDELLSAAKTKTRS